MTPVSTASSDQPIEELRRELAEAREQQAATAEILAAISSSPTDLEGIFSAMAACAARLCDANDASTIHQVDGGVFRLVAHQGSIPAATLPLVRGMVTGRAIMERRTVHVADLQAETDEYPEGSDRARSIGFRTILAVPLIRGGEAIGVIAIRRREARPFTDRHIELLKTFADQAVIAIENARLFEAEQASKRELQDSLEYQTATSEVLSVISRSPTALQPVLQAIADTAARMCETTAVTVFLKAGDGTYRLAVTTGINDAYADIERVARLRPGRGSLNTLLTRYWILTTLSKTTPRSVISVPCWACR
jgi:GAF domain-containing protein